MPTPTRTRPKTRRDFPGYLDLQEVSVAIAQPTHRIKAAVPANSRRFGAVKVSGQHFDHGPTAKRNLAAARVLWLVSPAGVEELRKLLSRLRKTPKLPKRKAVAVAHEVKTTAPAKRPAVEGKYGTITAELKEFHEGEPVFLIRATDPLAVPSVLAYAHRAAAAGCSPKFVRDCRIHAEAIKQWQYVNRDKVKKLPD